MSTENHIVTTTVDHRLEEVFAAVLDVRGWWSQNLIGNSSALHDEFVFTDDFTHAGEVAEGKQGIRFARFQLVEVAPGRRVVWRCVDACLTFIDDHAEWSGTRVIFEIEPTARGASLHFTHEGLTADEAECFEACSRGWQFYIGTSLPQLITSGTGQPMPSYRG